MGGFFGVVSKRTCISDLFYGTDYHSHLGTKLGGLVFFDKDKGYQRQIHSIENTPFRSKFEKDLEDMNGTVGIGCISDTDPQPLLVRSHLGLFAISTIGIINNAEELINEYLNTIGGHFDAMTGGRINCNELIAALINRQGNIVDGIRYAQRKIKGSCTILLMFPDHIIAARDRLGRIPVVIGKNEDGYCVSFEPFAFALQIINQDGRSRCSARLFGI